MIAPAFTIKKTLLFSDETPGLTDEFNEIKSNSSLNEMFIQSFGFNFEDNIRFNENKDYILYLQDNDIVIGLVLVQPNYDMFGTTYISGLCVKTEYRRRKIATQMMRTIIELEEGKNLALHIHVHKESYSYLASFYESVGFQKTLIQNRGYGDEEQLIKFKSMDDETFSVYNKHHINQASKCPICRSSYYDIKTDIITFYKTKYDYLCIYNMLSFLYTFFMPKE